MALSQNNNKTGFDNEERERESKYDVILYIRGYHHAKGQFRNSGGLQSDRKSFSIGNFGFLHDSRSKLRKYAFDNKQN